jgi:hypothetical protein
MSSDSDAEIVAGFLADGVLLDRWTATGKWRGHSVTFRRVLRQDGSYSTWWTEIDVSAPAASDVWLEVRPMTPDLARGDTVQVPTGDLAYDAAFHVKAGPSDVIPMLFDERLRGRLLALKPVAVLSIEGGVRVEKEARLVSLESAREAVDVAVELVARIPEAFAAADRKALLESGVYRGQTAGITAQRKAEVARLVAAERAFREEVDRRVRDGKFKIEIVALVSFGLIFALWLLSALRR